MDRWFFSLVVLAVVLLAIIITLPVAWYLKPLIIIAVHFFFMFVVSRFVVPRLGFRKSPLPKKLGPVLQKTVASLTGSKEDVLRKSYDLVTKNFFGERGTTLTQFSKAYWIDVDKVWSEGGFAQCTTQAYFLRLFLVKSGKFKEEDIRMVHTIFLTNIHQFLAVKMPKGTVYLDAWAHFAGIPFARRIDYWHKICFNKKKYKGIYRRSSD